MVSSHITEERRMDVCIQKIKQGGLQGIHFRLVNKDGKLIEDPHNPAIAVNVQTTYLVT